MQAIHAKPRPSKTQLQQQKTKKQEPKQTAKSVRRTLAPRLSLVDQSPQTDNELADLSTYGTSSATGARRSRLKRRTPAQKAGKPATAMMHRPSSSNGSRTPERADSVDNASRIAQLDPADDGMPSQGSLDSPVGCDEDPAASRSSSTTLKKKSSDAEPGAVARQGASKKPLVQKVR